MKLFMEEAETDKAKKNASDWIMTEENIDPKTAILDMEIMLPGQFDSDIERSRRDGMLRAWNLATEEEKNSPGYDDKY